MNPPNERKLKIVYDMIENKQYKKALKQCNSQLSKSSSALLLALKALTLQKLSQFQESTDILDSLLQENPTDQHLIEIMGLTYRSMGQQAKVSQLYSNCFATNPTKEAGDMLFGMHAAAFDFEKQQQVAMKLYKTFDDPKYAIFALQSMALLGYFDPSHKSTLNIAGMLVNKVRGQANLIKVEIFIEQCKKNYQGALKILEEQAQAFNTIEYFEKKLQILKEIGSNWEIINTYQELFRKNLAEDTALMVWSSYSEYVSLVFDMTEPSDTVLEVDSTSEIFAPADLSTNLLKKVYSDVIRWRKSLDVSSITSKNLKRTSRLAELLIVKRMITGGFIREEISKTFILPILQKYLLKYYDIPSTVQDISTYLSVLNEADANELLNSVSSLNIEIVDIDSVRRLVTYWKLKYRMNLGISLQETHKLVESYLKSLEIEAEPKKGEHRQADGLILLASRGAPSDLISISLLEAGIAHSPFNYFLKLELISYYKKVGAFKSSFDLYQTLDIKSVQHESLGFMIFGDLNDWRIWKHELESLCNSIQNFHHYARLNLADSIKTAYQHHNAEQVIDFRSFQEKLDKSYSYLLSKLLKVYDNIEKGEWEQLKNEISIIKVMPKEYYELICDLTVMKEYEPICSRKTDTENIYGRWTKYEYFLVEYLCLYVISMVNESDFNSAQEKLIQFWHVVRSEEQSFYMICFEFLGKIMDMMLGKLMNNPEAVSAAFEACQCDLLIDNLKGENLKEIAFLVNTVSVIFGLCMRLFEKLFPPLSKKERKKQKNWVNYKVEVVNRFRNAAQRACDILQELPNPGIPSVELPQELQFEEITSLPLDLTAEKIHTETQQLLSSLHKALLAVLKTLN